MTSEISVAHFDVQILERQVFSHAGGTPRFADVYLPKGAGPFPAIIFFHGGGWRFGDRHLSPDLKRYFAQQGFVMVSVDYRLSDEALFPAAVIDCKTAVRWLRAHAEDFNVDRKQIGLWGSSSGGNLASMVGLTHTLDFLSDEWADTDGTVQAVAQGYGPTDFLQIDAHKDPEALPGTDPESVKIPNPKPTAHPDSLESLYLGASVTKVPNLVKQANPATYAANVCCPFLILHGTFDAAIPMHQSRLLFDALCKAKGDCTLMEIEGLGHGFLNRNALDDTGPHLAKIQSSHRPVRRAKINVFEETLGFFTTHLRSQSG